VPWVGDPDEQLQVERGRSEADEVDTGGWIREHVRTPPGDVEEHALDVLDVRSIRDPDGQA
jgi:hypothetical protein